MRARALLPLAVLLAGCRDEPAPEPKLLHEPPGAHEVPAFSPRTAASWARDNAREQAPAPQGPRLESVDVGNVLYPVPSPDDFDTFGLAVTVAHDSATGDDFSGDAACTLFLLHGWLRVTCAMFAPSISVLGGSLDGLYLAADEGMATITMALIPGDRRVLQLARGGGGYGSSELTRGAVLSETWVGTTGPHVVITSPVFVQTF
jgi:hypothetical protein